MDYTQTVRMTTAVIETIHEMYPQSVPGGVIYAILMGAGVDFEGFQTIMDATCCTGLVKKSGGFMYTYCGKDK